MTSLFKRLARSIRKSKSSFPKDYTEEEIAIILETKDFTMTSRERVHTLIQAVKHLVHHNIEGSFVECGVWRGGSMLAAIRALQHANDQTRELWLYDTYEGMPQPTKEDVRADGSTAKDAFDSLVVKSTGGSEWCRSPYGEVEALMQSSGYPMEQIHLIKGMVEDTIPKIIPDKIALLRLDTDWYNSTLHEMEHLYPRLQSGGILIIDDYGYWKGSRQAVDEYVDKHNIKLFLHRIDKSARIAVKP